MKDFDRIAPYIGAASVFSIMEGLGMLGVFREHWLAGMLIGGGFGMLVGLGFGRLYSL